MKAKVMVKAAISGTAFALVLGAATVCCGDTASNWKQCDQLLQSSDYSGAISVCRGIIAEHPGSDDALEAMFKIAQIQADSGQSDQALQAFRAMAAYPKFAKRANLQTGYLYLVKGKYPEAITALKAGIAAATPTNSPEDYDLKSMKYHLVEAYRNSGDWDDAIANYNQLISDYPEDVASNKLDLAGCYMSKGDYSSAMAVLQSVKRGYPDKAVDAQLQMSECYVKQKKYSDAALLLKKISSGGKIEPETLKQIKYTLSDCYRASKDFDSAIAVYQEIIANYPDQAGQCGLSLADCYAGKGDYQAAVDACNQTATDCPAVSKDALLKVDDLLGDQGKYDDQIDYLNKLCNDYSDYRDEILMRRAITRSDKKHEYREAIADLQEIVTNYPQSSQVPFAKARIIGLTLHGLGDKAAARQMALEFVNENPDYGQMMFVKGDIATSYFQDGKYADAVKMFQETLSYDDPGNYHPYTLYLMVHCYKCMGDMTKATDTLKRLEKDYPTDCWAILAQATYAELLGGVSNEQQR